MTHGFDREYWEQHWQQIAGDASEAMDGHPANPYLMHETGSLTPGTALDAGCGAGAEAIWLATQGWQVTAADIAPEALARAARRAAGTEASTRVRWVEADLTVWDPGVQFDLVTTNYAHPAGPQLSFYDRVATWVAPGGTLLIVGHRHTGSTGSTGQGHQGHHGQESPAEASVTLADITARLAGADWTIDTAAEHARALAGPGGQPAQLQDVVVRATRGA